MTEHLAPGHRLSGRTRCSICQRLLDQQHDPLSVDCGGDCLGCMIWVETGEKPDGVPHHELTAWVEEHLRRDAAMFEDRIDETP